MPNLDRTVSAAATLAQLAEDPSRAAAMAVHQAQHCPIAGQSTPRQQVSWTGNGSKIPSSPFAANIIADSRSHPTELTLLHTSCATVPERSDEAHQDSLPDNNSADDAQSRPPGVAMPQRSSVPLLQLGVLKDLPPDCDDESSQSDADSDSEAATHAPDGEHAGEAVDGVLALQASGIELTGDADEDVRRMLALEGYGSDSTSYSSDQERYGTCAQLSYQAQEYTLELIGIVCTVVDFSCICDDFGHIVNYQSNLHHANCWAC